MIFIHWSSIRYFVCYWICLHTKFPVIQLYKINETVRTLTQRILVKICVNLKIVCYAIFNIFKHNTKYIALVVQSCWLQSKKKTNKYGCLQAVNNFELHINICVMSPAYIPSHYWVQACWNERAWPVVPLWAQCWLETY